MASGSLETYFVQKGVITPDQLAKAQELQTRSGGKIGDILLALGIISEDTFQKTLAEWFQLDFYETSLLASLALDPALLRSFPASVALESLVLPIKREGDVLHVAALSPLPPEQEAPLRERLKVQSFRYGLASREALAGTIRRAYGRSQTSEGSPEALDPSRLKGRILQERWLLDSLLGQGGSGAVFQGRHLATGRASAIKVLLSQHALDPELVARFRQEAEILLQLNHPRIVEVYEYGFEAGLGSFLAMEFLQGCSLAEVFEKNHLYEDSDIVRIAIQVCEAMEYAHQKAIIHRDLKPANIFLLGGPEKRNSIKVLDFGIARLASSSSKLTNGLLGTPRYLSPEQAMGSEVDHRTDIYSLCVILFEGLARKPLFEAQSHYQYLMRHAYAQTPLLSEAVPRKRFLPSLERLIHRGLSKDPKARPASMRDLRHELQILLPSQIQLDKTPAPPHPTLPPSTSLSSPSVSSPSVASASAPVFGRRPTYEQIPMVGKRPTYEQIPHLGSGGGKRPTYEQIPMVGKRPTYEQIPSIHAQDNLSLVEGAGDRPKRRRGLSFEELAKIPASVEVRRDNQAPNSSPSLTSRPAEGESSGPIHTPQALLAGAAPPSSESSYRPLAPSPRPPSLHPAEKPPPSERSYRPPSSGSFLAPFGSEAQPPPSERSYRPAGLPPLPPTSDVRTPPLSEPILSPAASISAGFPASEAPRSSTSHPLAVHPSPSMSAPLSPPPSPSPSPSSSFTPSALRRSQEIPLPLSPPPRSSESLQNLSSAARAGDLALILRRPAIWAFLVVFALFFFALGRCSVQRPANQATSLLEGSTLQATCKGCVTP